MGIKVIMTTAFGKVGVVTTNTFWCKGFGVPLRVSWPCSKIQREEGYKTEGCHSCTLSSMTPQDRRIADLLTTITKDRVNNAYTHTAPQSP
jgi:hypothetical protein